MEQYNNNTLNKRRLMLGAIFLMVTSAVGPAFLTQTAVFTEQFAASFAFAIILSVIIDIGAQLNIWRVLTVANKRGQDVGNMVLPGLGSLIAILIVIGGLAFNIGNIAGAGMGFNALLGLDTRIGAIIAGVLAIIIFSSKNGTKVMDVVTQLLGITLLVIIGIVMIKVQPPYQEAATKMIIPDDPMSLVMPIITIVGGSVGGYITFAGAHRLIEAGVTGEENLDFVSKSANIGIITAGIMRFLLFLAALGVITAGVTLSKDNPPATIFEYALGDVGLRIFGLVLLIAAITSVIGAAYTSASFLRSFHPIFDRYNNIVIIGFIIFSTMVFAFIGKPVVLLIVAGAFNGMIIPIILTAILIGSRKKSIVGDYHHPTWMIVFGYVAVIITLLASFISIREVISMLFG